MDTILQAFFFRISLLILNQTLRCTHELENAVSVSKLIKVPTTTAQTNNFHNLHSLDNLLYSSICRLRNDSSRFYKERRSPSTKWLNITVMKPSCRLLKRLILITMINLNGTVINGSNTTPVDLKRQQSLQIFTTPATPTQPKTIQQCLRHNNFWFSSSWVTGKFPPPPETQSSIKMGGKCELSHHHYL